MLDIVLVNNTKEDHKMCVDFTNVNIATLKDRFPSPNINQLVDATDFEIMSFMNACSRYHQIRMHPKNEEKITGYLLVWKM